MRLTSVTATILLLLAGCITFTLKDLRENSIHTTKTVQGDYHALGTCLARWLDENTAGGRVSRHYPKEQLFQIQGLRSSAGGGFQTLVELQRADEGTVRIDTYVARDVFRFRTETITERFFRGLGTCMN